MLEGSFPLRRLLNVNLSSALCNSILVDRIVKYVIPAIVALSIQHFSYGHGPKQHTNLPARFLLYHSEPVVLPRVSFQESFAVE